MMPVECSCCGDIMYYREDTANLVNGDTVCLDCTSNYFVCLGDENEWTNVSMCKGCKESECSAKRAAVGTILH